LDSFPLISDQIPAAAWRLFEPVHFAKWITLRETPALRLIPGGLEDHKLPVHRRGLDRLQPGRDVIFDGAQRDLIEHAIPCKLQKLPEHLGLSRPSLSQP
jgi:hypothetical protein